VSCLSRHEHSTENNDKKGNPTAGPFARPLSHRRQSDENWEMLRYKQRGKLLTGTYRMTCRVAAAAAAIAPNG
jgi:hypothetical protein